MSIVSLDRSEAVYQRVCTIVRSLRFLDETQTETLFPNTQRILPFSVVVEGELAEQQVAQSVAWWQGDDLGR